jgi:transcriptional regulator with XRE-family HTH domain
MPVPAGRELEPSPFARAFSSRVRVVMAQQRVTGKDLAEKIGVSRSYLGKRLRDEASFTLTDVEEISKALGMALPTLPEI